MPWSQIERPVLLIRESILIKVINQLADPSTSHLTKRPKDQIPNQTGLQIQGLAPNQVPGHLIHILVQNRVRDHRPNQVQDRQQDRQQDQAPGLQPGPVADLQIQDLRDPLQTEVLLLVQVI